MKRLPSVIINSLLKIREKKAFSLLLVLFALSAFSVLAVIMLYISSHWTQSSVGQVQQLQTYYLAEAAKNIFLERHIAFTNDFSVNPGRFAGDLRKTLGDASHQFEISYADTYPPARGPLTVFFIGRVLANGVTISQSNMSLTLSEDATQNQNILNNLRNFNGYFNINRSPATFSCLDAWGNTRTYNNDSITLMASCLCWDCNGNCGCCATAQSEIFMAKTYFNAKVNLKTVNYSPYPKFGSSTSTRNVYTSDSISLSGLIDPATNGIWGNLYHLGYFTDSSPTGMHGTRYACASSADPGCDIFDNPPTKPALDTTDYDLLIAKAETVPAADFTISTISSPFGTAGLELRNIFINGNVTINSSSSYPLLGPGTIVATGNIILGNNVNIRDQITLVAKGNIYNLNTSGSATGPAVRIGGTLEADDFIYGYGVIMYARGDISIYGNGSSFAANQQPRVKAFLFTPNAVNFPATGVSGSSYLNRYSQMQGLIYARTNGLTLSNLHGNIYIDDVQLWDLCGAFWAWKGHAMTIMRLYDTVGPSGVSTNYYLPIRLEGLYRENIVVMPY